MTYEEAIEILQEERNYCQFPVYIERAIETAISAIEKQIPKEPKSVERYLFECPCCKDDLGVSEDDIFVYEIPTPMYCSKCGQALDWSDTE